MHGFSSTIRRSSALKLSFMLELEAQGLQEALAKANFPSPMHGVMLIAETMVNMCARELPSSGTVRSGLGGVSTVTMMRRLQLLLWIRIGKFGSV